MMMMIGLDKFRITKNHIIQI